MVVWSVVGLNFAPIDAGHHINEGVCPGATESWRLSAESVASQKFRPPTQNPGRVRFGHGIVRVK